MRDPTGHAGGVVLSDSVSPHPFRLSCIAVVAIRAPRLRRLKHVSGLSVEQRECLLRIESQALFGLLREVKLEQGIERLPDAQILPVLREYFSKARNRRGLLRLFCLTLTEVAIQNSHLYELEVGLIRQRTPLDNPVDEAAELKLIRRPRVFTNELLRELLEVLQVASIYRGKREWQVNPTIARRLLREVRHELQVMARAFDSRRLSDEIRGEIDQLLSSELFSSLQQIVSSPIPRDNEQVRELYESTALNRATKQWAAAHELVLDLFGQYQRLRVSGTARLSKEDRAVLGIGRKLVWICMLHILRSGILIPPR